MKWLTAEQACERLGIKSASLYSYVSRGHLAAKPALDDPRQSLYSADQIDALTHRKRTGRKREAIAKSAVAWGEPVLESALTTVRHGLLWYRDQDACALSEFGCLEDVAALFWQPQTPKGASDAKLGKTAIRGGLAFLAHKAQSALPISGRHEASLQREAWDLLDGFGAALTGFRGQIKAHERLGKIWGLSLVQTQSIRRALVLLADHELNPSTFAARVAASTGASLPACALAGMATLTGPKHGEAARQSIQYLRSALLLGPKKAVADWLLRGQGLPGFGHTLYPSGDPRANTLLSAINLETALRQAIEVGCDAIGQKPNIDMALAALAIAFELEDEAPFTLFAYARMVGWLSHAIEQSQSGLLLRPRARYTGPEPI
jgi:citrate synthase